MRRERGGSEGSGAVLERGPTANQERTATPSLEPDSTPDGGGPFGIFKLLGFIFAGN